MVSFRAFLSNNRVPIFIVLTLAFALRLALAVWFPHDAGDTPRYRVPAMNILAGHGFSSDEKPPIKPSEHTVPGYPLFIAAVFAVFGEHDTAVRIAQSALDLITCLFVAFVSFSLAPTSLKTSAAMAGLIIYGLLCWFTVSWTRYLLTETLATFVTMSAVAVTVMSFRNQKWRWAVVGLICGGALLVRGDSVLLAGALGLFLLVEIVRRRSAQTVLNLVAFCLAIPLVLAPWTIRNYISLGKFQPLASAAGMPHGEFIPYGYIWWVRTWMTDQTHFQAYHPALVPGSHSFDPRELPDDVFDSAEQRAKIFELIDEYNQQGKFTPEMDNQFRSIAYARIKRAPLRFFVWIPLQRMAGMWLTGFATTSQLHRLARILLVLPILVLGIVGFAFWARNNELVLILLLIVSTRTLFFGFVNSSEHYIVEAYPLVIAAAGVAVAALLEYANRIWRTTPISQGS